MFKSKDHNTVRIDATGKATEVPVGLVAEQSYVKEILFFVCISLITGRSLSTNMLTDAGLLAKVS